MLPSNPRPRGLPSAPRSRSAGPTRREPVRQETPSLLSSSRYTDVRPSASRGRDRGFPPPLPTSPSPRQPGKHAGHSISYDRQEYTRPLSSRNSGETTSSSSSSRFGFSRTDRGYDTPRTSLEDNDRSPLMEQPFVSGRGQKHLRSDPGEPTFSQVDERPSLQATLVGDSGNDVWSRVANAASYLTVSVSKAWAANITLSNGEETPQGQESRLTRAMKAYHLEKARDPSDLPAWLFDDRDRRTKIAADNPDERRNAEVVPETILETRRPIGLRAIYDSAAKTTAPPLPRSDSPTPSRAVDRLKAMRDAKRGMTAGKSAELDPPIDSEGSRGMGVNAEARRPPRVGLPSGPMRARRQ